jgi:thiol-disulfide isomerase/thioredoxin
MITRRTIIAASLVAGASCMTSAIAAEKQDFKQETFEAAQKAGKPILVWIHASWCPTCAAQAPILAGLENQPRLKDLTVFQVDFDSQKAAVKHFGAQIQATLITYKGTTETGRLVAETDPRALAALLDKAL